MPKIIKIKSDSTLVRIMDKMIADKKVINKHISKGGALSDLKGKIGLNK